MRDGMEVLSTIASTIEEHGLLVPGQRIVLGVSGGADSLCALDCLHRLGYQLVVAHLDHQLRRGAWREAERVLAIARDYQLPAVVERKDVRAYAGHGRSLEEAARIVRYDFLVRVAAEHKSAVICTGHTADDQVETILMHLLRGAGPSGLAGMSPSTRLDAWVDLDDAHGVRLVRPLLDVSRDATRDYCLEHGLEPIADPSNQSPSFFRNRIRLELIPILEQYNPSVREVILRTAQVMRAQAEFLNHEAAQAWSRVVREAGPDSVAIGREHFGGLPRAVQRAILREAVARILPAVRDLGFQNVERAIGFIVRPAHARREGLPAGLEMLAAGDEVIMRREGKPVSLPRYPQLTSDRRRRLQVPGITRLASGWALKAGITHLTEDLRRRLTGSNADAVVVDRFIADGLSVGPARPGDRLRPFGMAGTTKVSDILINSHIPWIARARWPVVLAHGIPVWVVGVRAAEETRLAAEDGEVVEIRLVAPESEG
jgi:tRNA(Ile)-lysidine synthase